MAHEGEKGAECSITATCRDLSLKRCCFSYSLGPGDVLPDDILVKILCCLPCQSAVACKLVCKRWLSLISTHSFVSCFISRQINKGYCHQQQQKHFFLKARGPYLFLTSQVPSFDISFHFLPDPRNSLDSLSLLKFTVKILASFDDLFLCCTHPRAAGAYFICNPFTKEWFELPPPVPPFPDHGVCYLFGFTHKSYYRVEDGGDKSERRVLVNSSCRFRVVRLKITDITEGIFFTAVTPEFEVDIFSSETWQWTTSKMQHSSRTSLPHSTISRNGFLYWLCYNGDIIVHDPYKNKVCYVVEPPSPESSLHSHISFSVSQGSLLGFHYFCQYNFKVWELEDEDHCLPKWRLERGAVLLNEYMVNSSEMVEWAKWGSSRENVRTFAAHPNDRNIFYLWSLAGGIGEVNLRTRKFKPEHVPRSEPKISYAPDGRKIRGEKIAARKMVVIKALCWPTPISALLNQHDSS